jgi:Inner membrane component of T3SS, cytoplasmic domain
MRVILEIVGGPDAGRKMHLKSHQSIKVGRTEWADFVAPNDPQMSGEHFSLQVSGNGCRLRDLDSRNGTTVNGKPVKETELQNGDEIVAGGTQFVIRIGSDSFDFEPPTAAGIQRPIIPTFAPAPERQPYLSEMSTPEIVITINASGLYQAQSDIALLPPRELVDRVQRLYPVYLILDFNRLGTPQPPDLVGPAPLFGWLPEAALASSPTIVDAQACPTALEFLESGWGSDAVVCFGSNRSHDDLVSHLQSCARMRRDAVLGFCWPAVLSALLANSAHEMVKRLLDGIDLVLMENPEAPEKWQAFSYTDLHMLFNRMNLPTVAGAPPSH